MREVLMTGYNKYYISPLEGSVKDPKRKNIKAIADRLDEPLGPEAAALYDEIDKRFRYKYPHEEMLTARSKYSVSAIRREENEAEAEKLPDAGPEIPEDTAAVGGDNEVVHLWTLAENQKKSSAADVGIVYHRIMEYLDFARVILPDDTVDTAYIEESAAYLVEKGAVDADAYSYVDLSRISGFFASDLGRRAARASAAGALRKEKPFTLKTARQGRDILVQGVIDCCFEKNGSMILIDYKSSFVRPGREHAAELERIRNEYKVQIELYSEAVLKGTGKDVSEAYLYLFKTGEALKM
jgi:ATP-dependent helicase/nuclease subunit A